MQYAQTYAGAASSEGKGCTNNRPYGSAENQTAAADIKKVIMQLIQLYNIKSEDAELQKRVRRATRGAEGEGEQWEGGVVTMPLAFQFY